MKRKTLITLMGEDKSSDHGQNEQKQLSTGMKFSEIWPEETIASGFTALVKSMEKSCFLFTCRFQISTEWWNEKLAKWENKGPFSQIDLVGKFSFCTRSSMAWYSWTVVSLNQCCSLEWDAPWSPAGQAKYEQGVIFEQLMSLPEQIAWKQTQWLALIL